MLRLAHAFSFGGGAGTSFGSSFGGGDVGALFLAGASLESCDSSSLILSRCTREGILITLCLESGLVESRRGFRTGLPSLSDL